MNQFVLRGSLLAPLLLTLACASDLPLPPAELAPNLAESAVSLPSIEASASRTSRVGSNTVTASAGAFTYRLEVGWTAQFEVTSRQYQRFVRYSSSDSEVAEVTSTGQIRARSAGTAEVTGTFAGESTNATVIVVDPVSSSPRVTALTISPRYGVPLPLGGVRQYTTSVTWSDFVDRPIEVEYQTTGGDVSEMGFYSAGQVSGTFMIIASCACGLADTAYASVGSAPAQLTSLKISPKTVTVAPGETRTFSAQATWSTGTTALPPVAYTASSGVVSPLGVFTAPQTPGAYRVILEHVGGVLRDTAFVNVTTVVSNPETPPPTTPPTTTPPTTTPPTTTPPTTTPPPTTPPPTTPPPTTPPPTTPPPTGGTGAAPFFSDDFESGKLRDANGFHWAGGHDTRVHNDRGYSGSHAMRFTYKATPVGKDATSEQRFDLGRNVHELWLEYYLFVPTNFFVRKDLPANNKFIMLFAESNVGANLLVGTEFERINDTANLARVLAKIDGNSAGGIRKDAFMSREFLTPSMRGTWQRVRIHFRRSSGPTSLDGVYEAWFGNTLKWRTQKWAMWTSDGNNYLRNGYLMGWANSGYSEETVFYIDDFKAYDKNPGWP